MYTLKILSNLLCYPDGDVIVHGDEMAAILDQEALLPEAEREALAAWMDARRRSDLMDQQADYTTLFDRGRALSLHLFEHVHGESRDRGQAMVDLMDLYRRNGFALASRELPDYVPLFLEYLSQRPLDEARGLLAEAMHVLTLLRARLEERGSPYALVFQALESLAGPAEDAEDIRQRAAAEPRDDTFEAIDEAWEDKPVEFGPGCASGADVQPVHWVKRRSGAGAGT
jgi:nitrate reductase delta subunit